MNNPKPDDIRPGDPIAAKFLNDSKNAGIHDVRFGYGMVGQRIGGKLVVSAVKQPSPIQPTRRFSFLAKITASSDDSADHSIAELDENLGVLSNGRTSTTARAFDDRMGVEVDKIVPVWQYAGSSESDQANPQYYFQPPEQVPQCTENQMLIYDADGNQTCIDTVECPTS